MTPEERAADLCDETFFRDAADAIESDTQSESQNRKALTCRVLMLESVAAAIRAAEEVMRERCAVACADYLVTLPRDAEPDCHPDTFAALVRALPIGGAK